MNSLLALILLSIISCSYAQKEYEIKYNTNGLIEEIVFFDTLTKEIVNTFNIDENNPYKNLSFPTLFSKEKFPYIELKGVGNERIFNELLPDINLEEKYRNAIEFGNSRIVNYLSEFNESIIINYGIEIFSIFENVIGYINKIYILNKNGNIISIIPKNNNGFFNPVITENKKYLAYKIGGGSEMASITAANPNGLVIYDLEKDKAIFQLKNTLLLSLTLNKNLIITAKYLGNHNYHYYVFNPNDLVYYTKYFSAEDIGKLVKIDESGFEFINFNSKVKYYYHIDFEANYFN